MAVETKVGLLVGLAFIVCFGVVLSHRGGGDRLSADVALELLNRHRQSVPKNASIAGMSFVRPAARSSASVGALPARDDAGIYSVLESRRDESRQAVQDMNIDTGDTSSDTAITRQVDANANAPQAIERTKPQAAKRLTYEALFGREEEIAETHTQSPKPAPNKSSDQPNREPGQSPLESLRRPEHPASNQSPAKNVYVVKPGDTLWRIASSAYGKASREIVDAIYEANRSTLPSPNKIESGMRLALPAIGGAPKIRQATAKTSARPSTVREKSPLRYYQVRSGDRYTVIAEKLLGDKSRWKELYELNKDIFPDAGQIRPGVRIRIPATTLASAN